jgi:hypothetical protein
MDTDAAVSLVRATVDEHRAWLSAALALGLIVGWMSYFRGAGRDKTLTIKGPNVRVDG